MRLYTPEEVRAGLTRDLPVGPRKSDSIYLLSLVERKDDAEYDE